MWRMYTFRMGGFGPRRQLPPFSRMVVWLAAYAVGFFAAAEFVPGIDVGDWKALLGTTIIFGVVNMFVRPLLTFVTCPLQILTLGLFTLIINTAMIALTAWVCGQIGIDFKVDGFTAAFFGALVVTIVGYVLSRWGSNLLYTTL